MDYFLVSFQSVADLVFSGYLGLFFFFYDMFLALNANCKSFTEEIHLQQQVLGCELKYSSMKTICDFVNKPGYGRQIVSLGSDYYDYILRFDYSSDDYSPIRLVWFRVRNFWKILKYIPDYFSFWSQTFTISAIALERYILIVHGSQAKTILSSRRRNILYGLTVAASLLVPFLYIPDYLITQFFLTEYDWLTQETIYETAQTNETNQMNEMNAANQMIVEKNSHFAQVLVETTCNDCIQSDLFLKTILPATVFLPLLVISGFLYQKTSTNLTELKQVERKELLATSFKILWVGWVICVTPYTIKASLYSLFKWDSEIDEYTGDASYVDFYWFLIYMVYGGYHEGESLANQREKYVQHRANFILETLFRSLKISYSFINSILLIVLLKPFNQPLIKTYKNLVAYLKQSLKNCRSEQVFDDNYP
ncbi:uncharacterized protein LOC134853345 [Symsagittifera roscoffensis]|uniref:uncharacterized protein LOC134853345 n=1 Tax=Symsagittifera roscoffensis TaxID=84072 RepID=UPI00307B44E6